MTAIKKSTTKSTKSPAPATKPAPAEKPAAAKKKPAAPAPAVAPAPEAAPVIAFTPPAQKVKPVASRPVVTTITAKIDVGFGNALYIRGEGPGLSWDRGTLMTCVGEDVWAASLGESARPITLKFLINDSTWSLGPDFSVESGQNATFTPGF